MTTPALFTDCVIPGCTNPVVSVGEPCTDCIRAFGPLLRENANTPPLTAPQIAERDRYVHTAYAAQREAAR